MNCKRFQHGLERRTSVGLVLVHALHGNVVAALSEHSEGGKPRDLVLLTQRLLLRAVHLRPCTAEMLCVCRLYVP